MQISALFPQILLFGDSIVELSVQSIGGIIPQLQSLYADKYDIVNRGFSGYTSLDGASLIPYVYSGLGDAPAEWTILAFGTDEILSGDEGSVLLDPLELVSAAVELNAKNIVVVSPGIVNEDLVSVSNEAFFTYKEQARSAAELYDLPFIDLWSVFRTYLGENPDLEGYTDPQQVALPAPSGAFANFTNSVNQSAFNITIANISTNATGNGTNFTSSGANSTNFTSGGSNSSTGNTGTGGNFSYIGDKGNPQNYVLSLLLTDGVHYTDLAYDLWLQALLPILNLANQTAVLPSYTEVNSTESLPHVIADGYVAAVRGSI